MDTIPCRTFYNLDQSCVVLSHDFHNPLSPEIPLSQLLPDKLVDTHAFFLDDPMQSSLLIQTFLSELQEIQSSSKYDPLGLEVKSDSPIALDIQEAAEPESDCIVQLHSSSGVPSTVIPDSHSLEYIPNTNTTVTSPANPLQNPLDDPFFSNIEFLEQPFVTDSSFSYHLDPTSPSPTLSSVCTTPDPVSVSSPLVLVDVQTVVSSSLCDEVVHQRTLDLSDCVTLLTDMTPSPASPCCSALLSSPSSCTSSASSKSDFFLPTPISPSSHTSKSDLSMASSPNSAHLNPLRSSSPRKKRKHGENSSEELMPVEFCEVSSKPSASTYDDNRPPMLRTDKIKSRRDQNNVASQISRSKRKQRHKELRRKVEELEPANEELRKKIKDLEAETEAIRNMLLQKLAQH